MAVFGFNSKCEAQTLSGLAKQLMGGGTTNGAGVSGNGAGMNGDSWGILCKTVSAIPARSADVAGMVDDVAVYSIQEDGTLVDTGNVLTVYNPFGGAVAADKYITVKFCRGYYVVDAEDCN